MQLDWPHFVSEVFLNHLHLKPIQIERFSTGLSLFVFDVWLENDQRKVIRIAPELRKSELESGIRWHNELEKLNFPLPDLHCSGQHKECGFAIYERLPGSDLEEVYEELSSSQLRNIAKGVTDAQKIVSRLDQKFFKGCASWEEFLAGILDRSRKGMHVNKIFDFNYLNKIESLIQRDSSYFSSIDPAPFLYDLSVRNVMIHHGKISGIIDVDEVWYGDPLLAIGRGKMLLLWMNRKLDLITYWIEYLDLNLQQRQAVDTYALLYCIRYMGALGSTLNGNANIQTDASKSKDLMKITKELLECVKSQ